MHGSVEPITARAPHPLLAEGLKLFFPVAAAHAVLLPLVWVTLFGFGLPFGDKVPPGQWHAHEMIFGTYGAALAGFLTSAIPEWTDTAPRRGRALLLMLGLWLPGRLIGFVGAEALILPAAATDAAFLALLFWFVLRPLIERRSTRHGSFALWVALFAAIELGIRAAWLAGRFELSGRLLHASLAVFLVFLSLAIARINVVVVNHALDPSGETTPYRPHPGRQNLTAGLVALQLSAALLWPVSAVPAWLALAAAAAFFDRLAEWFIGRAVFRWEVLALAGANAFGGLGFAVIGLAGLGAPVPATSGLHLLSVGALGLAAMAVLVIAGLRHSGRDLVLPLSAKAALGLMACAGLARVLPELGIGTAWIGLHYTLAATLWSASFAVWLAGFWPILNDPRAGEDGCG
jgi:uncharacterized protein involved in response to NO